ncbi:hypothetical protein RRG08_056697 [Elysia crispata]|uniref:ShKT domain-containing protein n=2 Tax=Elysia crispata TaxID=231223 RepID=A0AAE1AVG2_9GAST|nr:hypothetical protein RRG08_056697 [Elysia crispata]KAK3794679.1 hypothetical protein RRG08_056697 [Elysia crispata]KAK3794681.1 hypothetical protein RRG08_056697 [Elysia crispata]
MASWDRTICLFLLFAVFLFELPELTQAGECFHHFSHGPYASVWDIHNGISNSGWGCRHDQTCKVKVHHNHIDARCVDLADFDHQCRNIRYRNTNTCTLDLALSSNHLDCAFCCPDRTCVLGQFGSHPAVQPPTGLGCFHNFQFDPNATTSQTYQTLKASSWQCKLGDEVCKITVQQGSLSAHCYDVDKFDQHCSHHHSHELDQCTLGTAVSQYNHKPCTFCCHDKDCALGQLDGGLSIPHHHPPPHHGGECFRHFHHGPHANLSQLEHDLSVADWGCQDITQLVMTFYDLSVADWGCQDITQVCEVKIHDNKVEARCHPIEHLQHHCHNQLGADPNICSLDLAVSGGHHQCSFCCLDKACVLSAKRTVPSTSTPSVTTQPVNSISSVQSSFQISSSHTPPAAVSSSLSSTLAITAATTGTTMFVCSSPYAADICQKFCGLCPATRGPHQKLSQLVTTTVAPTQAPPKAYVAPPKTTVAPPIASSSTSFAATTRPTTPLTPSTTASPPSPSCYDKYDACSTQMFVCSSPYAADICQKFCGLCPSGPTRNPLPKLAAQSTTTTLNAKISVAPSTTSTSSTAAQTPTTMTTLTTTVTSPPSGCYDKYDACSTQMNVCSSPYAADICQKFCGLCPATQAALPNLTASHTTTKATQAPPKVNVAAPLLAVVPSAASSAQARSTTNMPSTGAATSSPLPAITTTASQAALKQVSPTP